MKLKVKLNSVDDIKTFVNTLNRYAYDFDLVSGRYVIDAKSIMGVYSLDISEPLDLIIHTDDSVTDVTDAIDAFIVK